MDGPVKTELTAEMDSLYVNLQEKFDKLQAENKRLEAEVNLYKRLLEAEQEDVRCLRLARETHWQRAEKAEAKLTKAAETLKKIITITEDSRAAVNGGNWIIEDCLSVLLCCLSTSEQALSQIKDKPS